MVLPHPHTHTHTQKTVLPSTYKKEKKTSARMNGFQMKVSPNALNHSVVQGFSCKNQIMSLGQWRKVSECLGKFCTFFLAKCSTPPHSKPSKSSNCFRVSPLTVLCKDFLISLIYLCQECWTLDLQHR